MKTNLPGRARLVFISCIAAPHQIKFCQALQSYMDAHFWFYETAERTRGKFWTIELGQNCELLEDVWFRRPGLFAGRYIAPRLSAKLEALDPDIVMVGGFSIPSNYIAYRWAKKNQKRTIVFTERSRDHKGQLRKWGLTWGLLRWLYRKVDMVMVTADDALTQYRDEFRFGERVIAGRYAADLDVYFTHPLRKPKSGYTYLYPNRMTEIYNPLGILEIFFEILSRYPESRLLMNAAGELGDQVRARVREKGLGDAVEFLTDIASWNDLHKIYARSDIMLLPARFSNGNFTILEAMASGMGIVISDQVLGIGSMVEDGVNGFRCPPTTGDFVERIERYIASPELMVTHAMINRPLVQPLSSKGTAKFFHDRIQAVFGVSD